jgi:cell division protein FtsB
MYFVRISRICRSMNISVVLFYIRMHAILLEMIKQVNIKCYFAIMRLTKQLSVFYDHFQELHKNVNYRGQQCCVHSD